MSLGIKYSGSFVGQKGTVWRADILVDGYIGEIGELTFPSKKPLEIEWPDRGKEEVLCGSTATLRIESPGDRTYTCLYTVAVGSVALRVYRRGIRELEDVLWWTGTLDTEFYEEPYERLFGYDVSLTFQDFGILDRLRFTMSGAPTLITILQDALSRSRLDVLSLECDGMSTDVGSVDSRDVLREVSVQSSNFYDEDGESMSLAEVLKGVLQPLGGRMVQRCGRVYVYDLHALSHGWAGEGTYDVVWDGKQQTLGVDRTSNRVKVTWSPYAQTDKLTDGTCWVKAAKRTLASYGWMPVGYDGSSYSTIPYGDENGWQYNRPGFSVWTSAVGKGAKLKGSGVEYFKILKQLSGDDCEGIALLIHRYGVENGVSGGSSYGYDVSHRNDSTYRLLYVEGEDAQDAVDALNESEHLPLFETSGATLPPVISPDDLMLKLTFELLLDVSIDPFSSSTPDNSSVTEARDWWKSNVNFLYIPAYIKFTPSDGGLPLYWNRGDLPIHELSLETFEDTLGEWSVTKRWCLLSWYSKNDRGGDTGVTGGWKTNRQMIQPVPDGSDGMIDSLDDGQYIPYPPLRCGGVLSIEILDRWLLWKGDSRAPGVDSYPIFAAPLWSLMKLPQLEIVWSDMFKMDLCTDDVEYSGTINESAQDVVDIETICGTARSDRPTALGVYSVGGNPVERFTRGGYTSSCEELLIRTLHSQWGSRHVKLEGEMMDNGEGLSTYSDCHQTGVLLMKSGEVLNAIEETTKSTLVELSSDEYTRRSSASE